MKKRIIKTNAKQFVLFLFFVQLSVFSQNQLSVPFPNGFIGVKGSNPQQATDIKNFSTLGIAKAFFMQNSASASAFSVQGNDVPGTLRLQLNSGQLIDIFGAIVWKENGGTANYLGFIPSSSFSSVSFSYGTGLIYTIYGTTTTSNIGLGMIGRSTTDYANNGDSINGSAAGADDSLNSYLATTNLEANRPFGSVTVTTLITQSPTPIVSGTVTLTSGESLSLEVNNVLYTINNGLFITAQTWSLTIDNPLADGTYSVVAKITNSAGYSLNDATINELTIGAVATRKFISKTGQQPDDISSHVNRYGEIAVSSLTIHGEEVFYTPKHSGTPVLVSSTSNSAIINSTITNTGGKSITDRGICWSTAPHPTTANSKNSEGTGKGSFNSTITGLSAGTTYYASSYAINDKGTSYSGEMSFTTLPPPLAIGDAYQGGVIAYFLVNGDSGYIVGETHGLIVSTTNQVSSFSSSYGPSYPLNYITTGATATGIGSGLANTNTIITVQGSDNTYAATMARAYTGGGYTDWYLPSKDELSALYFNKTAVNTGLAVVSGSSLHNSYLSSSESRSDLAWSLFFGTISEISKGTLFYVRAIRSF
jgi:hypothetical protein